MSKKITLLGSTGSIGTQSLDVARMHGYSVFGLAANSSVDKLLEQINEFHPKYVAVVNPDAYAKLSAALAGQADAPKLLQGAEGLRELAAMDGPDVVLNAVVGIAGLPRWLPLRAATTWPSPIKRALLPAATWSPMPSKNTASNCCLWTANTAPYSSACRMPPAPKRWRRFCSRPPAAPSSA